MNKAHLLVFLICCSLLTISLESEAQISGGGTPPSFRLKKSQKIDFPRLKAFVPSEDIELLKKQDAAAERNGMPPIVATLISSRLNLADDGLWEAIGNDSVCRLSIGAQGALGIILYYERFSIPNGGELFIYNKDKTQLIGAYTSKTNPRGRHFSTEMIYGDTLTLEYVHPKGSKKPEIVVSDIGYGYNLTDFTPGSNSPLRASAASSNCYVDVNCSPEGDKWQQEKKGVAKMIIRIGAKSYLCSGSLVNNVYQDYTPYFLSAHHCFEQNSQTADFATIQFYFHYEAETCGGNVNTSKVKTMVGADMLVDIPLKGGSDGALLRLAEEIPQSYDVFYNGWDITSNEAKSGAIIHHPQGDLKKISTFTQPPTTVTFIDLLDTCTIGGHWKVIYTSTLNGFSVTAGGSSGSPMFNQDGRIVGTLSGGESFCSTPSEPDYYAKFSYHWNKAKSESQWMSKYLNGGNYPSVTKIDGIDRYTTRDTLTGIEKVKISSEIVDGELYISSSYAIRKISIYDMTGRLVLQTSNSPIDIPATMPRGVYVVAATTTEGNGKFKFIKK